MITLAIVQIFGTMTAVSLGAAIYHMGTKRPKGVTAELKKIRFSMNKLDTRVEALINDPNTISRHG